MTCKLEGVIITLMKEQEVFFHNCALITPLEKDPVPLAKNALSYIERNRPGVLEFPEAISAATKVLDAPDYIRNSLMIGVIRIAERRKKRKTF